MAEPSSDSQSPASGPVAREGGEPSERQHASDPVFRELASAILNRELSPGTPLPPERELAERFRVSRIVVREAIHRLKEYELVRVRQGSPTVVLDPDRATDIRLLGLEIELVSLGPAGLNAFTERQMYSGASLLDLAEQRMTDEELDVLEKLVREYSLLADKAPGTFQFERAFWTTITRGTQNRVYLREVLWHFNLLEREPRFRSTSNVPPETRIVLYTALLATLRSRSGSAAMYLSALRANRDWLASHR